MKYGVEVGTKPLLVVDQFEEAFVILDDDHRGELLTSISEVVASTAPAAVVLAMRDEFFSQFVQQAPPLTRALEDGLRTVPPILSRHDLNEVVAEPAQRVGVRFADGLVERIVDDAVTAAPGIEDDTAASIHLPKHASWLNQVEIYLSVVETKSCRAQRLPQPRRGRDQTARVPAVLPADRHTFEWKFTKADLNDLLDRITAHENTQLTPAAYQPPTNTPPKFRAKPLSRVVHYLMRMAVSGAHWPCKP